MAFLLAESLWRRERGEWCGASLEILDMGSRVGWVTCGMCHVWDVSRALLGNARGGFTPRDCF